MGHIVPLRHIMIFSSPNGGLLMFFLSLLFLLFSWPLSLFYFANCPLGVFCAQLTILSDQETDFLALLTHRTCCNHNHCPHLMVL